MLWFRGPTVFFDLGGKTSSIRNATSNAMTKHMGLCCLRVLHADPRWVRTGQSELFVVFKAGQPTKTADGLQSHSQSST